MRFQREFNLLWRSSRDFVWADPDEMFESMEITDAMLAEFCVQADEGGLAEAIHQRYDSLADRITLYMPFVPGGMDQLWKYLAKYFNGSGE